MSTKTSRPEKTSIRHPKQIIALSALVISLGLAVYVNAISTAEVGLWGLLPIGVYAVLVLLEQDVVLSTGAALVIGIVLIGSGPIEIGTMLSESLGSFIAVVGLIIMLGAGLGRIATETGAAQKLVQGLLQGIGMDTAFKAQIGIMLASTVLVGALGTLAGANAILAPIVIPVAAAVHRSRTSVAVMLHTGGAAGLVIGPFTPPVVAIRGAAGIDYLEYLLSTGLPMAVVVWIVGFFMARWIQKRTAETEQYTNDDLEGLAKDLPQNPRANRAAVGFIGTIAAMAVLGIFLSAGFSYAIVVMIVAAIVTALLGGLRPTDALKAFYTGASQLLWLFILFWLFNPLLLILETSGAYDSLLNTLQPTLENVGPWPFLMITLLIGWLGVSGAAVAQVVLIDKLLWPLASTLGIPPGAWAATLLGGSQIDWFGPLPNADMIGQMGLARSSNLRMMLFNGWTVMATTLVMFSVLFVVLL